jgi:hypothetical protein
MVFFTMVGNIFFTKEDRKGNNTWGLWCKTNLKSQTFLQVNKGL